MQTFLGKTAEHLIQQHSIEGLKELVVVLPSQRSALYLKKELAKLAQKTFIAPKIFTIEEFVIEMTGGQIIDSTELLFKAYDIFKQQEPEMNLDKFVVWGNFMLRDFDLLDMYLVDPNQLYAFLSEVKAIERWGKEYGEEQLEQYLTPNTQKYFQLYDHLNIVYHQLNQHLKALGVGYRGMFFRKLVEDLSKGNKLPIAFEQLYFVGFNALSTSEEELIRLCLETHHCQTLWDVDSFYLDNSYHRAGNWLRNYANPVSKKYLSNGPFNWKSNDFKEDPKQVQVIGFENPSGQIYGAMQLIDQWAEAYGTDEQVALVLADENLLDQAMYYLGAYRDRLNITMGFSLRKTYAFDLTELYWALLNHQQGNRLPVYLLQKIFQLPLVKQYFYKIHFNPKAFSDLVGSDFRVGPDKLFPLFEQCPLLKFFFTEQPSFLQAIQNLKGILKLLVSKVAEEEWDFQQDAALMIAEQIAVLEKVLDNQETLQLKSGAKLLKQLILQQKISFEGSEKRTLHVMGLLETRNLDFDRVIILSLNEGFLPSAQKRNSLIPMDVASMALFNLPTFTQADAVTSYHFHRLLQRPKDIVFCHILPGEKSAAKEESRFIKQLRLTWPAYNPQLDWKESIAVFTGSQNPEFKYRESVEKTPEIQKKIGEKIAVFGLSPSALNSFISCGMKFYLAQVEGLRTNNVIDDEMGANVFGTWVHQFLETLDKEIADKYKGNYQSVDWNTILNEIDERLEAALLEIQNQDQGTYEVDRGFNVILKEVAKNILSRYLKNMPNWRNNTVQVLGVEEKFEYISSVQMPLTEKPVKLQGRVDKIDLVNNFEVQIIDFKTGKVDKSELKIKESNLFEALTSYKVKDKLVQLWMYKLFILNDLQQENTQSFLEPLKGKNLLVNPGIISFRNLKEQILQADLTFEEGETTQAFLEKSEEVIAFWIQELFRLDQPFVQTDDEQKCKYCDFASICRKD